MNKGDIVLILSLLLIYREIKIGLQLYLLNQKMT